MIKLVMLSGFLGAGKTTLLQNIIDEYTDSNIGVLVNEFGAVSIDSQLVEKEGLKMTELSNGSIFCACLKDKFVDALVQFSKKDLEYLFIEASGLADPANMTTILKGIEPHLTNKYEYAHSICVVDGTGFLDLVDVLVAVKNQIEFSDIVILNKTDLISEETKQEILSRIADINPDARVIPTEYCKISVRQLVEGTGDMTEKEGETSNTFAARPQSVVLRERKPVPYKDIRPFLEEICGSTYRIKGFLNTGQGAVKVDCVGDNISVEPWNKTVKDGSIVVISSVGIRIVSVVTDAMTRYLEGSLSL